MIRKIKHNKFPCTGCGCCCKRVDIGVNRIKELAIDKPEFSFPYKWDQTGRCENLQDDNSCSIYDKRPIICNIDKVISLLKISKKEFYKLNIISCNKMMDEDNISSKYRIITN